jgi:hypothetical protein
VKPVIQIYGESFLYTCSFDKAYTYEQFIPEHLLAYQISGQTLIFHQRGEMVLEEGQFLIGRRNQFAKSIKVPAADKEYQCISVIMTNDRLQQYALDNEITCEEKVSWNEKYFARTEQYTERLFPIRHPVHRVGQGYKQKDGVYQGERSHCFDIRDAAGSRSLPF